MELKESCEKYADVFILKAYEKGGRVSSDDIDFAVPKDFKVGVNILLKFYGTFFENQSYILSKDGMEFARRGAFSGVMAKERKENHKWILSISLSIIAIIIAAIAAYAQFR